MDGELEDRNVLTCYYTTGFDEECLMLALEKFGIEYNG